MEILEEVAPVPEDGVEFELSIDGDAINPLEMVRDDGYDPKGWEFLGPAVQGRRTETFVHLNLGYCRNRQDAKTKADGLGYELAEGPWRVPYRARFPKPTRAIATIFGESEWQHPRGRRSVASLDGRGVAWNSDFHWSDHIFYGYCRWVARKKK